MGQPRQPRVHARALRNATRRGTSDPLEGKTRAVGDVAVCGSSVK